MPRLRHADYEQYQPEVPSPLGLYRYTAADLGQEVAGKAGADLLQPSDVVGGADSETDAGDSTPSRETQEEGSDDLEESPRKRRRISYRGLDGEERTLTITYDQGATTSSSATSARPQDEGTSTSVTDAGWSFRPLEEDSSSNLDPALNDRHQRITGPTNDGESTNEEDAPDSASTPRGLPETTTAFLASVENETIPDRPSPTLKLGPVDLDSSTNEDNGRVADNHGDHGDMPYRAPNRPASLNVDSWQQPSGPTQSQDRDEVSAPAPIANTVAGRIGRTIRVGSLRS